MSEKSESAARVIAVALKGLIPIAENGNLGMLAHILGMALQEAGAQGGEKSGEKGAEPSNVLPFDRH